MRNKVTATTCLALWLIASAAYAAHSGSRVMSPSPALATTSKACTAAKAYVDLINARRYSEVGNLFAERVDYIGPDAIARQSKAEVAKVYEQFGVTYKAEPPRMRATTIS